MLGNKKHKNYSKKSWCVKNIVNPCKCWRCTGFYKYRLEAKTRVRLSKDAKDMIKGCEE